MPARPLPTPPRPGQESVWDYPRPPRLESSQKHLRVRFAGRTLAETRRGYRVLETSHPPVYYFPPDDVDWSLLESTSRTTFCEWKGAATYVNAVVDGRRAEEVGWRYLAPKPGYGAIKDHVAFYAGRPGSRGLSAKDFECSVDGEVVEPQPGGFYGGWITSDICGPFKGEPDSWGW